MIKLKIKSGDIVKILAGDHKGEEGKVMRITKDRQKAYVEGVNMVKKHLKPTTQNPQGGIEEREAPIHMSNLSLMTKDGHATRVGYKMEGGKKVRFSKKTNEVI